MERFSFLMNTPVHSPSISWFGPLVVCLLVPDLSHAAQCAGSWETFAPMPSSRQEVGVGVLNGRIYVIGGLSSGQSVNTVERFDRESNSWEQVADLPAGEPLNHVGVAAVGDRLFVIGGLGPSFSPVNTVFSYDPATGSWNRESDMPRARGAMGVAALDGKIYAAGGAPNARRNDFAVYDPSTDTWTILPNMPTPRDHLAAVSVAGKFLAISGRTSFPGGLQEVVEAYDPASDQWTGRVPIPTARGGLAAAVVNGLVYLFGGEGNRNISSGVFAEVEEYDPGTDTWRGLAPMPNPRHGIGAAVIGGRIFIPGGGTEEGLSDSNINDAFTPPGSENPFSLLPDLGEQWRLSPWLGFLNDSRFPWIFHLQHGWWFTVCRSAQEDFFFFDLALKAWLYTSSAIYPNIYAFGPFNEWFFYAEGTANPRMFINLSSGAILEAGTSQ